MKTKILILITILSFLPQNIYAYSNKIIVGGETIGIEVSADGVYVVGFYEVNDKLIAKEAGFQVGDIIKKINDTDIDNIQSLNKLLNAPQKYSFQIIRNNKEQNINMNLIEEDNLVKTGLYVKDTINGIGTLSYIDPESKIFGSLGHEIIESSSATKFNIKEGNIYKAEVSSIKKSKDNITGEKNASIDKTEREGTIQKNEATGIYGFYENIENTNNILDVGTKEGIKKGEASIKTVIEEHNIEEFKINIISIDESDPTKNILFEITDEKLISATGGIVQGMSGSPIIQNNKIIGVVNYVIVEEETKGYGIFITTMLEEGDKINS